MLIIESSPDAIVPQEQGKPVLWTIRNTNYILTPGIQAQFIILFNAGGLSAGASFTIGSTDFASSGASVQGYTSTTFYSAPSVAQSAKNFANMIRANYRFVDWSISIDYTTSAPDVIVRCIKGQAGEEPAADWINDISALLPIVGDSNFIQGQDETRANTRLWYQFWRANTPISERKTADFDPSGRSRIDAEKLIGQVLSVTAPYLLWNAPTLDALASRRIYLRFGAYRLDNCEQVFDQVYESPEIHIVNAIYQHNYLSGFRPFTPQITFPCRWMTTREMSRVVCRRSFEWCAIYIQNTSDFHTSFWRVKYTYYNAEDAVIDEQLRGFKGEGVYHVPTGPQNPCHPAGITAIASYYTVQVQVKNEADEYVPYSELMTIMMDGCNCHVAEIYFLEDAGSWRTIGFERVAQRRVEIQTVDYERPLATNSAGGPVNGLQLFQIGGRYSEAESSDAVFTLTSEKINEHNRAVYEEFLRSKEHYILTSSDILSAATRRVIIDRGSKTLFQRGGVTRLTIDFRFNTEQRVRP